MEKTYNLSVTVPFENISIINQFATRSMDIWVFNIVTAEYEPASELTTDKLKHYLSDNKRDISEGRTPTYLAKLILSFIPEKLARQKLTAVLGSNIRILKIDFTENP